jgi:hypothetical protein
MSRQVLWTTIKTRIRRAADIENDTHVSDSEIYDILDRIYPGYWDLLIDAGAPEFSCEKVTFSSVAGTQAYSLATTVTASANDFYRMKGLFVVDSSSRLHPVVKFQDTEIHLWKPIDEARSFQIHYYKNCPSVPSSPGGSDYVEGHSGFEEWLVHKACAEIKRKRQEEYVQHESEAAQLAARITKNAHRDGWEPYRVQRRKNRPSVNIYGYQIKGNTLELCKYTGYEGFFT